MAENKFSCVPGCSPARETVCIDTNRVLDSCRDRDCFENARVYLSDFGNEVLGHTSNIRAKSAKIVWTCIDIEPIRFNRGFYSVNIRFYVILVFEACVCVGRSQEIEGITVLEKRVILYGGESNVSVFKSHGVGENFCGCTPQESDEENEPTAIVEVVSPVILGTRIVERVSECKCCCCCHESDIPKPVLSCLEAPLCFGGGNDRDGERYLTVSLGIFSVIRIVRSAQYLIQATEYCIPEKECVPVEEDDPCRVFRSMPFPTGEFCAQSAPLPPPLPERHGRCGCNS
ncbi:MAG: hypothetical protein J6V22_04115 [Clostridia bacterium]|nr:hypothetical protein [Clostridia bacterium]